MERDPYLEYKATRPETQIVPFQAGGLGTIGLGPSAIFVRWADAPGAVNGFYRMAIAAAGEYLTVVFPDVLLGVLDGTWSAVC